MTATMKALAWAGAMLALACCFVLPARAADGVVLTLARLAGTVEVKHTEATGGEWQAAKAGAKLAAGWTLRTGKDGKAQLIFPRDNVVILKENSVLYVENLESGGGGTLASDGGDFLVNLKNALSPGSEFEVKTPSALAVVRGTKFGVSVRGGDESVFYGYESTVEITNQYGTRMLEAGMTITATPDATPGEPQPSGTAAAEFLADAEDEGVFAAQDSALAGWAERFQREQTDAAGLRESMQEYRDEWRRYFERDETAKCVYLYAQTLILRQRIDDRCARYFELLRDPGLAELAAGALDVPAGAGSQLGADGLDSLAQQLQASLPWPAEQPLGGSAALAAQEYAAAYGLFAEIADDAGPLVDGDDDALDKLHGLLYEDDSHPELGLRWNLADSDNDGLADLDEELLGTDPYSDESQEGYITLTAPADGAEYQYPEDDAIEFSFEPLDSDYITGYNLILEAGRRQFMQANVEGAEEVPLALLAGPGGAFLDAADAAGAIEVQWRVVANVDEQALAGQLDPRGPAGAGFGQLASETRTLTIQLPAAPEGVVLDLVPAGATDVTAGQQLRVEGEISEVTGLGQFEIEVSYDPSLLEFDNGRKLGDLGSSTLFFSDSGAGLIRITGVADTAQAAEGIEGAIFELEFTAREPGSGFIEVSGISAQDTLGRAIDAEGGDEAEYTVAEQMSVDGALDDGGSPNDPGKPERW
jgi:hypothetical protein